MPLPMDGPGRPTRAGRPENGSALEAEPRLLLPPITEAPVPPLGQVVHALAGESMGTTWSVRVLGPPALRPAVVRKPIEGVLEAVVAEMSHWEPTSHLSRFNAAAPGTRHRLPAGFATVLQAALALAEATGGAFDPAAGALVRRWGFGPPGLPEAAPPAGAGGWRALAWNGENIFQDGFARLDFSAIAKGFAVDRVAETLAALGLPHHLVEIGGELRGRGCKPDGLPWWVDLEDPAPDGADVSAAGRLPPLRVALHGLAVATSGDYRQYRFDPGGARLSHTLDPRAGRPIPPGLAAVSVLHASAMWADGWATALTVLGAEDGLALATERGLAARFVRRAPGGLVETLSPAMREMLA